VGMIKIKKILYTSIQALLVVGGLLIAVLGWVFTFVDVPQSVKNFPWILIGNILFFFGTAWVVYDLYRKYVWWAEPVIKLTPKMNVEFQSSTSENLAYLVVQNEEEIELTECHASLQKAINLYGENLDPVDIVEKGYLYWKESKTCSITIPPKDERTVKVASSSGGFRFSFCEPSTYGTDLMGLYSPIIIRIDGKLNGKSIKPQFFNGYLFVNNYLGETGELITTIRDEKGVTKRSVTTSQSEIYTEMVFEEGDWKNNEKLRKRHQHSVQRMVGTRRVF
jgi:hypothetical protein